MIDAFFQTSNALQIMAAEGPTAQQIEQLAHAICDCHRAGGTVFTFGNGGSSSEADHFAGELIGSGRFLNPECSGTRPVVNALSLTSMPAAMTAVANDLGYLNWPAAYADAIGKDDVVVLLSTSCADHTGRGSNVLSFLDELAERFQPERPEVFILTGEKFRKSPVAALKWVHPIIVPHDDVCVVQEATLAIIHAVVRSVEVKLCSQSEETA